LLPQEVAALDTCISNILSEVPQKRAVAEEGAEQELVALQRAGVPMSQRGQFCGFEGRPIGKGIHFQIAPGVLDRIEFGGVGRQEKSMQVMDAGNELHRPFGAVGIEAIPNQHTRTFQFLVQVAEETDDLAGANLSLGMQAKVKPHPVSRRGDTQSREGCYLLQPTPALNQPRRLAPRLPTAADQRPQQQAAFIEENQPGLQPVGFF
jgi:hypothetical protein